MTVKELLSSNRNTANLVEHNSKSKLYIELVIYDNSGAIIDDGLPSQIDSSVLDREIRDWYVDYDQQDTGTLIMRITVAK